MDIPEELREIPGIRNAASAKIRAVYFLVKRGVVVYVGQSTNLCCRLMSHRDKAFDSAFFVEVKESDLYRVEARYIRKYSPIFNRVRDPKIRSKIVAKKPRKKRDNGHQFDICGRYILPINRVPEFDFEWAAKRYEKKEVAS